MDTRPGSLPDNQQGLPASHISERAYWLAKAAEDAENRRARILRRNLQFLVMGLFVIVVFLALMVVAPRTTQATIGPDVGSRAPDFTLKNLYSEDVSLQSFRGHPVVLLFWAVDCGYCQDELDGLKRAVQETRNPPTLIAVDVWHESPDYIASYVRNSGMPGTILVDPFPKHTPQNVLYGPYQGYYVPSVFYIDATGFVRHSVIGEETYSDFMTNFQQYGGG
jgi:peroxiredoxin